MSFLTLSGDWDGAADTLANLLLGKSGDAFDRPHRGDGGVKALAPSSSKEQSV
jgi:hypothetical protein